MSVRGGTLFSLKMNILFPVLASILFGSVAAALVSHFLTSFRADSEYRLRKLEELYLAVEASSRDLRLHYHHMLNVAEGTRSWEDAAEKGDALMIDFQRDHHTAKMIASIYFPDLVYVVDRMGEVADQLHKTIDSFRAERIEGNDYPAYQSEFAAASQAVRQRKQEVCEKIVETSKDVRRGWFRTLLRSATSW